MAGGALSRVEPDRRREALQLATCRTPAAAPQLRLREWAALHQARTRIPHSGLAHKDASPPSVTVAGYPGPTSNGPSSMIATGGACRLGGRAEKVYALGLGCCQWGQGKAWAPRVLLLHPLLLEQMPQHPSGPWL